jgi:putative hydrolase of the HAD superfamily
LNMIRGIIFDLGSTLMYFEGKWDDIDKSSTQSLAQFLNAHGVAVGPDFDALFHEQRKRGWKLTEETNVEHTVEQALRSTLTQMGSSALNGLLPRAVEAYLAQGERQWRAYSDAIATLQALQAHGLRIGLISNADDDGLVQRCVKRLGFAPYLSPVLSSAVEPYWRKPDPRIFHLVSDGWQLPPSEIAMVGDAARYDIVGAHRAGMRGILIDRGENAPWQNIPDELANDPAVQPDAKVTALADIPPVIEKW